MKTSFPFPSFIQGQKRGGFYALLFALLFLSGVATYTLTSSQRNTNSSGSSSAISPSSTASSQLLVYGYWEPGKSYINAFDLQNNKTYALATLPENIKHVSILPSGQLLYVGNTDKRDYGTEIDSYSLKDKTTVSLLKADPGFGIDDYMVSPNGRYLAEYEIQFSSGSSIVYGGNERIYSFDLLHPMGKQLIDTEVINHPIPYPRGVTNDGRIFFDTWLPNSNDGWAYGMIVTNNSGTNKQNITSMTNGTYGRQPELSPDGKQLAFIGYDGNQGDGTATDAAGIRRIITASNTVELLDTTTLQRTKMQNLSNKNLFDSVYFDKTSGNLIINQLTAPSSTTTTPLFYDLNAQTVTPIPVSNQDVLATVASNRFLTGTPDTSGATIGNLGNEYQSPYNQFSIFDLTSKQTTPLSVIGSFKQFITFLPAGYLPGPLVAQIASASNETLQFGTFDLKPALDSVRETQQNEIPSLKQEREHHQPPPKPPKVSKTELDCKPALYLYPDKQEQITVKLSLNGELTYTNPLYPPNGWQVIADPRGKITYHNQTFDYLYYEAKIPDNFFSEASIQNSGYAVAYANLQQFFSDILPKLGLNSNETHEFTSYWLKALPNAPYYKVSLLPQALIDTFAPLTIDPKPDTILRVTLYFQPLDQQISLEEPKLLPVQRSGFTVVEWAGAFKSDKNHPFTCLM